MKDHSKMSDFEICGYVSMHEHGFSWIEFDDEMSSHVKCGNEGSPGFAIVEVKDYCNNPSDAWPIIVSMISGGCIVQMLKAGVIVTLQGGGRIQVMDKNPLRVAMIAFLMMKDEEK